MATDTRTAREKLGLDKPGGGAQQVPQQPVRKTPLVKAQDAYTEAQRALDGIADEQRALGAKRDQLGVTLARQGKLSRVQRSELSSVRAQLKKLGTAFTRAAKKRDAAHAKYQRLVDQANERHEKQRAAERAKAEAAKERAKAANQRKLDKRIAAIEAKALKQAGAFVRLPEGAKPSRGTSKDAARPFLAYGFLMKEGRGKTARWVLVVTDTYGMAVLPAKVTGTLPPLKKGERGVFIPPEALKVIDKTRAFKLTKKGGVQPVTVTLGENTRLTEPPLQPGVGYTHDPARVEGWARTYNVKEVGTGFMVPDEPPTPGGRFVDPADHVPKPPATKNVLEWAVNPNLLKQFAEAIGAGSGDMGNVVLTFDLSKVGKAADGRRVESRVTIQRHDQNTKRPVDGPVAVLMPVKLAARK